MIRNHDTAPSPCCKPGDLEGKAVTIFSHEYRITSVGVITDRKAQVGLESTTIRNKGCSCWLHADLIKTMR